MHFLPGLVAVTVAVWSSRIDAIPDDGISPNSVPTSACDLWTSDIQRYRNYPDTYAQLKAIGQRLQDVQAFAGTWFQATPREKTNYAYSYDLYYLQPLVDKNIPLLSADLTVHLGDQLLKNDETMDTAVAAPYPLPNLQSAQQVTKRPAISLVRALELALQYLGLEQVISTLRSHGHAFYFGPSEVEAAFVRQAALLVDQQALGIWEVVVISEPWVGAVHVNAMLGKIMASHSWRHTLSDSYAELESTYLANTQSRFQPDAGRSIFHGNDAGYSMAYSNAQAVLNQPPTDKGIAYVETYAGKTPSIFALAEASQGAIKTSDIYRALFVMLATRAIGSEDNANCVTTPESQALVQGTADFFSLLASGGFQPVEANGNTPTSLQHAARRTHRHRALAQSANTYMLSLLIKGFKYVPCNPQMEHLLEAFANVDRVDNQAKFKHWFAAVRQAL
ncbi:hypothetical protein H4R34_002972 [Dimargaris verticillata]|uniref:Uncharacterized protein n=1 Tax=Dimargaris verticillata TaxID=2761393 RepID=A0A9W8B7S9_9FUNG|nr:hypothetical protein H4R34_002972 [Dimargaris verticillata]